MSNHTRGPWVLNGEGIVHHPVTGKSIVTKRIETSLGNIEVLDETNEPDANLRLIVAAPELLTALRAAVWYLPQDTPEAQQAREVAVMVLEKIDP